MASVSFRLKTPTKKETTIICRFYSKQTKALDFSTGEKIPSEFWQGQRVSSKYKKDHDRINKSLSKLECDLLDVWRNNKNAEDLKALITAVVKGTSPEKKNIHRSCPEVHCPIRERERSGNGQALQSAAEQIDLLQS